ncbi:MAG: sulfatase-like hydrolase/transferase [Nocardioidaceae bacterium]
MDESVRRARPDRSRAGARRPARQVPGQATRRRSREACLWRGPRGVDQSVARLLDYLENTPDPRNPGHPLADNTLVLFASDNGGHIPAGAYNKPLKGMKSELDEGGVRVPFIAWSPNPDLVAGDRVVSSPINSTDFYPTLADLGGASLPNGVPFDGTSLRRVLVNGAALNRPRFQHFPGYINQGAGSDQRPQTSVRDRQWKLLYSYETQEWELYDLQADIRAGRTRSPSLWMAPPTPRAIGAPMTARHSPSSPVRRCRSSSRTSEHQGPASRWTPAKRRHRHLVIARPSRRG